MTHSEAASTPGRLEYWLLAASVTVGAGMLLLPALIPVALGLACWAAVLLATRRPRRTGALVGAITVVAVACGAVAALGIAAAGATSTSTPEVTLIRENSGG